MDTPTWSHTHSALVVADHGDMREAYEAMLRVASIEVTTTGIGAEALERLNAGFRPCVVLLDFRTPLDGVSLRQRIRSKPELAPIAVVLITNGREYVPTWNGGNDLRGP